MTTEFDVVAGAVAAACGGAAFTPPAADARGPLDWSRIARLVGRHRVLPLAASGFGAAAPDALRASWRAELGPHAQRSLHLLATAGAIASRFDAAGIRALAVKGPVLAVVGYGDPLRRSYGDLDFWVARADLVRAAECLAAEGYTLDAPLVEAARRPSRFVQATLNAARPGVDVELHGEAFIRFVDHTFDFDGSWATRRAVRLGAHTAQTLDAGDTLHYLALHGDWHNWERLQWVADLAVAARACDEETATRLARRAARAGHGRVLASALTLARTFVALPMPSALADIAARPDPRTTALVAQVTTAYRADSAILGARRRFVFHLRSRDGRARRHYLAWCGLSASAADVAAAGLPPRLSWLSAAWRVPGLLARYARPTSEPPSRG
jgi:hypothetical protein